jgi:hypothetical protein
MRKDVFMRQDGAVVMVLISKKKKKKVTPVLLLVRRKGNHPERQPCGCDNVRILVCRIVWSKCQYADA